MDASLSTSVLKQSIDNIAVERFFRSLKYEDIYLKRYETLREAKRGIDNYIRLYNTKRLHSAGAL